MTSRERVLMALNHREPDRVPIDFGGMRSTGIMAIAYNNLKKYLGIEGGETKLFDIMQQLAEPEEEILQRFGVDVIALNRVEVAFEIKNKDWKPWQLPDGSPCLVSTEFKPIREPDGGLVIKEDDKIIARMPPGGIYFSQVDFPLASVETLEDLEKFEDWPSISDEELEYLHRRAKWLYENTEYAIMGAFGGNILEGGQFLRGWDIFLLDLVTNPKFAEHLMDKLVEHYLEDLNKYIGAVGDYIQIIQLGDDLGTQQGPQISPELYRHLIKPRHKKIYQYIKEKSNLYVFLHSCGSIFDLIPDLIEAGVDILNPVQTSAAKMAPITLKEKFGDKITFWSGGCDTQKTLPFGSPEEVREEVKSRIQIFAPRGGFVFNQVHNIQANVPPANIVAMFEAAREFGGYPVL